MFVGRLGALGGGRDGETTRRGRSLTCRQSYIKNMTSTHNKTTLNLVCTVILMTVFLADYYGPRLYISSLLLLLQSKTPANKLWQQFYMTLYVVLPIAEEVT